jgi:hypothetical protein
VVTVDFAAAHALEARVWPLAMSAERRASLFVIYGND